MTSYSDTSKASLSWVLDTGLFPKLGSSCMSLLSRWQASGKSVTDSSAMPYSSVHGTVPTPYLGPLFLKRDEGLCCCLKIMHQQPLLRQLYEPKALKQTVCGMVLLRYCHGVLQEGWESLRQQSAEGKSSIDAGLLLGVIANAASGFPPADAAQLAFDLAQVAVFPICIGYTAAIE